jgi:spermidine synthase
LRPKGPIRFNRNVVEIRRNGTNWRVARPSKLNLILLILFFLSGSAALIYEVIWLHLLRLSIGVSTYSLAVILSVFMGGMAVGSLLSAYMVSRALHPLRVYAALEFGIGGFGLAMPVLLPTANQAYVGSFHWHEGSVVVRAVLAAMVLLPPTALMGATLPVVSRWLSRDRQGAADVGWLYAANIFGAVAGSLLAGTVLMQYFDTLIASVFAATINAIAGLAAWQVAAANPVEAAVTDVCHKSEPVPSALMKYQIAIPSVALFLSGFAALGAEVIWTRLLTLSLGPTVYAFSLVLAVFLVGLGIGSSVASILLSRIRSPLVGLALCQLALIATVPLAANSFSEQSLISGSLWKLSFAAEWPAALRDITRTFLTVFPSAFLWGASFPFAVAAVFPGRGDQARDIGFISAANTLGAIGGALGTTLFFVPLLGTYIAQQTLVAASALAACCCLAGYLCEHTTQYAGKSRLSMGIAAIFAIAALGIVKVHPPSPALFAYGREAAQRRRDAPYEVVREGVHTPIVVTLWPQHGNTRALHLAGKLEASDDKIDLRLERMLGHIPQFLCEQPRSVLVIGLGAGITAGSFVMDERTEALTICELEPALPPITAEHFGRANRHVLSDPLTHLIIDDGRHFLQTTDRNFDVISVDPIHPWVRGAAALYSKEFFRECLDHLEPGGIVSYWVPMHSMTTDSVKSEIATFFEVFPHAMVWHTGGTILQRHMLLIGSNQPYTLNLNKIDELAGPGSEIEESIHEIEFGSVDNMLSLYVANKEALKDWVVDAQINSDMNLRLEYLAGAAAYQNRREEIFRDIIAYRKWPKELFRGDKARLRAIRENFDQFDALEDPVPKR